MHTIIHRNHHNRFPNTAPATQDFRSPLYDCIDMAQSLKLVVYVPGVDASGISNQAPNTSYRLQISTEAIAEFKVDTMLFGADTGGTAGGQVEVVSKAGSNDFHGSVFEYIRKVLRDSNRRGEWFIERTG